LESTIAEHGITGVGIHAAPVASHVLEVAGHPPRNHVVGDEAVEEERVP
jgi:hypothetical protein